MTETLLFLRQLITKPKQISAIAPSSRFLANAMTRSLGPNTGRVVEFGPGTGVLTRGILARGVAEKDLTLFEMNKDFAALLRTNFPEATLHLAGAQTASTVVAPGVGAVVSGLPLLSMPNAMREAIVKAAFDILRPNGVMIQFTYGQQPPVRREEIDRLGLSVEFGPKVWFNLPPARVFLFRKIQ
jgi:phosphatidylethanolamine/phosphatidyl-N-methylethanolamine N-methyltransferase